ncbi:MAG: response regulator [Leptospiraceae bacterium]|nr:response regulator [Leptospiraceae bacterium]MCP5500545.1 response regulator [Leptospiraceae bacterium]
MIFLLIDDDHLTRNLLKQQIYYIFPDCEIIEAENGKDGIEELNHLIIREKNKEKVVFLDLNMPVINGFEFLDLIQNKGFINIPKLNYFILTSSNSNIDMEKAKEYIFVQKYLVKPLNLNFLRELKASIRST